MNYVWNKTLCMHDMLFESCYLFYLKKKNTLEEFNLFCEIRLLPTYLEGHAQMCHKKPYIWMWWSRFPYPLRSLETYYGFVVWYQVWSQWYKYITGQIKTFHFISNVICTIDFIYHGSNQNILLYLKCYLYHDSISNNVCG